MQYMVLSFIRLYITRIEFEKMYSKNWCNSMFEFIFCKIGNNYNVNILHQMTTFTSGRRKMFSFKISAYPRNLIYLFSYSCNEHL